MIQYNIVNVNYLYGIPFEVKIVKNLVATFIDTFAMWIGLWIYPLIKKGMK